MNDFQMCIFLVFPWKKDLGRPEEELKKWALSSVREAPIFLKGALRAVWEVEEAELIAVVVVAAADAVAIRATGTAVTLTAHQLNS
jgi:hypothetical protein